MRSVVAELRKYLPGWKLYFQLADTPKTFVEYDKWLRHRLRLLATQAVATRIENLRARSRRLGLPDAIAAQATRVNRHAGGIGPPCRSTPDSLPATTTWPYECPDLPINLQPSEPPRMRTRMSRWCGRGVALRRYLCRLIIERAGAAIERYWSVVPGARSGRADEAGLLKGSHTIVQTDLIGTILPFLMRSTVVPVNRIFRPVVCRQWSNEKITGKQGRCVCLAAASSDRPRSHPPRLEAPNAPESVVRERFTKSGHEPCLMSSRPRRGACREYCRTMSGAASSSTTLSLQVSPQNSVNQRPTRALLSSSLDMNETPRLAEWIYVGSGR